MTVTEIILIGVALAMDAFALTIANCATYKDGLNAKKEWAMPVAFAVFQFMMPVIGYYVGSAFSGYLEKLSKYLTALIFFVLAAKIVFDNLKELRETEESFDKHETEKPQSFTFAILITQAVATSIDALMIGVTFAVNLTFSIFFASLIIGAVTFAIVAAALFIGRTLGKVLGKYAQWLGALILMVLAIKNLIEGIIG